MSEISNEDFVDPKPNAVRRWLMTALAVAVFQAAYWLGAAPLFSFVPVPQDLRLLEGDVAPIAAPTRAAMEGASFQHVELPWEDCCNKPYYGMRHTVTLAQAPERDYGMVQNTNVDNLMVFVNGRTVLADGRMAPTASYHGMARKLVRVPAGYLHAGDNTIEVITARNALPYSEFGPLVFGDYATIERYGSWRLFVLNEFKIGSALMMGLIALVALALMAQARNKEFAFWLAALSASWALYNTYYIWYDPPFSPAGKTTYYFFWANAIPMAWVCFIDVWTGKGWAWLRAISVAAFAIVMGVTGYLLFTNYNLGYELGGALCDNFTMACAGVVVARFLWHMATTREERHWEVAAFALCVTAVAVDALNEMIWHRPGGNTLQLAPFLLFALVVAVASRNLKLYESMSAFNDMLSRRLSEREAEIRERYEQLQAMQKAHDLAEERQRIMRDMHDGIGGQLTGLLLELRADRLSAQAMARGIESSLNDLRLVVDSLDQEHGSLAPALASLRARLERQTQAAGVTLAWRGEPDDAMVFAPAEVLQISRIVQEAVTNALRHAEAKNIVIAVISRGDTLTISVKDDGRGLPAEATHGRGLNNMRARAQRLGGELSIANATPGVEVRLQLERAPETTMAIAAARG